MYELTKRSFDLLFSILSIVMLSPLMLVVALAIKMDSPGPVLYRGKRTARGDGIFHMYKFRTMVVNAESLGGFSTAVDDARFTRIGRTLRKYKLDELPQLFNVLIGNMSLVGPRPQVKYYTDKYEGEFRRILSVKPGITDFASLFFIDMDQILGSGDIDSKYEKEIEPRKNQLRLKYVNERSLVTDLRILFHTAIKVLKLRNLFRLREISY